jgi:cytochrome P450/NADPH-cytochrome P450 reductase
VLEERGAQRLLACGEGDAVENRLLSRGGPAKRHIEFVLPEDMNYKAGDYLAM